MASNPDLRYGLKSQKAARTTHKKHLSSDRSLEWVGYHRAVTVHQVGSRFFSARRKSASYGECSVQRLVSYGYLTSDLVTPERGRASSRAAPDARRLASAAPSCRLPVGIAGSRRTSSSTALVRRDRNVPGDAELATRARQETAGLMRAWLLAPYHGRHDERHGTRRAGPAWAAGARRPERARIRPPRIRRDPVRARRTPRPERRATSRCESSDRPVAPRRDRDDLLGRSKTRPSECCGRPLGRAGRRASDCSASRTTEPERRAQRWERERAVCEVAIGPFAIHVHVKKRATARNGRRLRQAERAGTFQRPDLFVFAHP